MSVQPLAVMVTGATSQIGRFLLPRLLAQGHAVHALSRNPPAAAGQGIVWHQADLRQGLVPAIDAQCVIHLAHLALLPPLLANFRPALPLRRVIAFGSTSRFSKEASPDPREQAVALELAQAEQAVIAACESLGADWTLFRPTLVYGCGLDKNVTVIVEFVRRFGFFPLVGGGKGLRQPVHADDLATACLLSLDNPASFNRAYNLSGGETLSYRQMVERIFERLGKKPRLLDIPLPALQAVMRIAALLPRYRYFSSAMALRMNQDLCFDHGQASRDFGFLPRGFEPC